MSLKTLQKRADLAARKKGHNLIWGKLTFYKGTRPMQFGTCEHCKHSAVIMDREDTPKSLLETEVLDLGKHLRKKCLYLQTSQNHPSKPTRSGERTNN